MTRKLWGLLFGSVTVLAVGMECWASWDGRPETIPWTDYIATHVPGEVTFAAIGALVLWLPVHFGLRYWRRHQEKEKAHGENPARPS